MSGTSITLERVLLAAAFGYGLPGFRGFAINAMKSAFVPFDERLPIIRWQDRRNGRSVSDLRLRTRRQGRLRENDARHRDSDADGDRSSGSSFFLLSHGDQPSGAPGAREVEYVFRPGF